MKELSVCALVAKGARPVEGETFDLLLRQKRAGEVIVAIVTLNNGKKTAHWIKEDPKPLPTWAEKRQFLALSSDLAQEVRKIQRSSKCVTN